MAQQLLHEHYQLLEAKAYNSPGKDWNSTKIPDSFDAVCKIYSTVYDRLDAAKSFILNQVLCSQSRILLKVVIRFKLPSGTVKPLLVATSIKQATCIKQAGIAFPKRRLY